MKYFSFYIFFPETEKINKELKDRIKLILDQDSVISGYLKDEDITYFALKGIKITKSFSKEEIDEMIEKLMIMDPDKPRKIIEEKLLLSIAIFDSPKYAVNGYAYAWSNNRWNKEYEIQ